MGLIKKSTWVLLVVAALQTPSLYAASTATAKQWSSSQTITLPSGMGVQQDVASKQYASANISQLNTVLALSQNNGNYANNVSTNIAVHNTWTQGKVQGNDATLLDQFAGEYTNNIGRKVVITTGKKLVVKK